MNVDEVSEKTNTSDVSDDEVNATQIVEQTTSVDQTEENKSDAILYDVLDQVFSYLNVRDLSNAAKVSKSWQDSARRELSSRGPENVILRYVHDLKVKLDYNAEEDHEMCPIRFHKNTTHVSNFIRTNPKACIFFTDNFADHSEPDIRICRRFTDEFSCESIIMVIETLGVSIDETEASAINNSTASLLLPSTQMVNVKVIRRERFKSRENVENEKYTHEIVDPLFPKEQEHTCIIMFHQYLEQDLQKNQSPPFMSKFHSDVLCDLKQRRKLYNYTLWGGSVTSTTASLKDRFTQATSWIGLSISGPTLRSWTIVLDRDLPNYNVEEKLLTLKKDVDLRSESVALMLVPSNKEITSAEKLSRIITFKKIFPTVRLLSLFNDQKLPVFSVDSNSNATDHEISHMNSVAYLILSYGKSHQR